MYVMYVYIYIIIYVCPLFQDTPLKTMVLNDSRYIHTMALVFRLVAAKPRQARLPQYNFGCSRCGFRRSSRSFHLRRMTRWFRGCGGFTDYPMDKFKEKHAKFSSAISANLGNRVCNVDYFEVYHRFWTKPFMNHDKSSHLKVSERLMWLHMFLVLKNLWNIVSRHLGILSTQHEHHFKLIDTCCDQKSRGIHGERSFGWSKTALSHCS